MGEKGKEGWGDWGWGCGDSEGEVEGVLESGGGGEVEKLRGWGIWGRKRRGKRVGRGGGDGGGVCNLKLGLPSNPIPFFFQSPLNSHPVPIFSNRYPSQPPFS